MTPGSRTATLTSSAVATIDEAGTDQPSAAASSAVTRTVPAVAALLSSAIGIDSRVDQKLTTGRTASRPPGPAGAWALGSAVGVSVGGSGGSSRPRSGRTVARSASRSARASSQASVAAGAAVEVGRGVTVGVEEPQPRATMSVRMRSAAGMPRVGERLMLVPSAPRASGMNWRTRPDSNRRSPA